MPLSELARILGDTGFPADLEGDDRTVEGVNTLELAGPDEISFLSNPRYAEAALKTSAGAIIAPRDAELAPGASALRAEDPYASLTVAIIAIHGYREHPRWGVHPSACIDPSAVLGDEVHVGPGVTIDAEARVGAGSTLYPGCYVGRGTVLGTDCVLFPNVVVYDGCVLGNRVTVHAGSVVGQDGLGFAPVGDRWLKIPQVGRAVLGDDVEIGANCCIDRATLGDTTVDEGSKFGNSIVIGHGSTVGAHSLLVGQNGLAGSSRVGRHVTFGGQAGMVGHIEIGDGARIAAQSMATEDVPPGEEVLGSPALPIRRARRAIVGHKQRPELLKRGRTLERELQELRARLPEPTRKG